MMIDSHNITDPSKGKSSMSHTQTHLQKKHVKKHSVHRFKTLPTKLFSEISTRQKRSNFKVHVNNTSNCTQLLQNLHDSFEFVSAMIKNIKIQNILDIIEVSKSIQLFKCTHQKNSNENPYLSISYIFLKIDRSTSKMNM
jgi:hypothetical protein